MKLIRLVNNSIIIIMLFMMAGCATKSTSTAAIKIDSPLGIYGSNTEEKFWLAILSNEQYLVCSPYQCDQGKYETVAIDYGVILLDFYNTEVGLQIEQKIHGLNKSVDFIQAMREIRLAQPRPNDQVFNITDCNGVACVGLGHSREGVKFYRLDSFDNYWQYPKTE